MEEQGNTSLPAFHTFATPWQRMEPMNFQELAKQPGGLRKVMPTVTAFIDQLREAFGKEVIDSTIKAGMRGEPKFWASENGVVIGTRLFKDPE